MKRHQTPDQEYSSRGSFLYFGIMSTIIIVLSVSFLIIELYGASFFSNDTIAALGFSVFFMIWTACTAAISSLPGISTVKEIICIAITALPVHLIFICTGIIERNNFHNAVPVFLIDFIIAFVLVSILEKKKLGLRWAFLYLFNPSVLAGLMTCTPYIFAGLMFFILAIHFYINRNWKIMFAAAGLSAGIFPCSIPAAIFLLKRKNIKLIWIMILFSAVSSLAVISFSESFFSLNDYISKIPGALAIFPEFFPDSKIAAFIAGISISLFFHPEINKQYRNHAVHGIFIFYASLTALLPEPSAVLFIWTAPLIALTPSITWIFLGFSASSSAAVAAIYGISPLNFPIWLPLYILLPLKIIPAFYRMIQRMNHTGIMPSTMGIKSISVIIPALNEEFCIARCIMTARKDPSVSEIIVVDGGSDDRTAEIAEKTGARVIIHQKPVTNGGGRGGQIKAGLIKASGDAVAILHADSVIISPVFTRIKEVLNMNPDVIGGSAGCRFMSDEPEFRAIEFANNIRTVYTGISFGDQVQFFRRRPVTDRNIFPDIPLMEDIELSIRLGYLGTRVFLFGDVIASTRRWKQKKFINSLWVTRQVIKYIWTRIWKQPDASQLYLEYYKAGGKK